MIAPAEDTSLPSVALQVLKVILSPAELRQARLVCREWATELVTAVHSVTLAPALWGQQANPRGLQRLLSTYSTFKRAKLLAGQAEPDAAAVVAAARLLQSVPALEAVVVSNLGGSSGGWSAVLGGLSALSRVTTLELRDVRLPGPDGLDALAGLPNIRNLVLVPAGGSKLQQRHVDAISKMPLKRLRLAFRATAGTRFEPVTLDCLGRPGSGLTHLDVRYTGMAELASGVCFAAEDCLPGCSSLQSLVLSRVPTPSVRGLFRLPQLTRLSVTQLSPLSETQARSVSLCTQLQQLDLNNLPLELLPRLAELSALTSLQVSLWAPPAAAGQDLPGGLNIISLAALSRLESFSLRGPVMLAASDATTLAAGWQRLRSLKLEVTLLDGAEGLAHFTALDSLAIAPWVGSGTRVAGMAGMGGLDEGPMQDWSGKQLLLQWADLPHSLRSFDGRQVAFAAPGQQQQLLAAGPQQLAALKLHFSPDARESSLQLPLDTLTGLTSIDVKHPALQAQQVADLLSVCCSSLASLRLDASSNVSVLNKPLRAVKHTPAALADDLAAWAAASSSAAGPGSDCSSTKTTTTTSSSSSGSSSGWSSRIPSFSVSRTTSFSAAGGSSSFYTAAAAGAAAVAVAAAAATAAGSGVAVATAAAATAGAATAGALSRSSSFSLGGRSSGGGARPGSASATSGNSNNNGSGSMSMLESLSSASFTLQSMSSASLASMLGEALWVGSSATAAAAAGLGGMGAGLADGPGLACIGQCSKLTELQVVIGERALSSKARAAITALTGLRRLSLAVAADAPSAAGRDLGSWVGRLRGLESVAFAVEGPGSSAVQLELCDRVAALLPACQVLSLKTTGR